MFASLYHHITTANNAHLEEYYPLICDGMTIGWVYQDHIPVIRKFPHLFHIQNKNITLEFSDLGCQARTAEFEPFTRYLYQHKLLQGWWDEKYNVVRQWGEAPLFLIERGACPFLGIRSWGVHMNGYVKKEGQVFLWVAKRSWSKRNDPGKLDNMVAGGQPAGLGILENLQKECMEEAGIPVSLSQYAKSTAMLSYIHEIEFGLKPDQIFIYDLQLPQDFKPVAVDGEVDSFQLMSCEEVLDILYEKEKFKYNCALVYIDFFIRIGFLNPDNIVDYSSLCLGLRK